MTCGTYTFRGKIVMPMSSLVSSVVKTPPSVIPSIDFMQSNTLPVPLCTSPSPILRNLRAVTVHPQTFPERLDRPLLC